MSARNKKVSKKEDFSNRVSRALENTGWTQEEMASALGVSRNYVSMVKNGRGPGKTFANDLLTLEQELASGPRGLLRATLRAKGLTPAELAQKIEYQIGVVQAVVDGSARIKEDMARKIEALEIGLTADQLMEGSETPRVMDETGQFGTVGDIPKVISLGAGRMRMIPLIPMAEAGPNINFEDEAFQQEAVAVSDVSDPRAFALRIRGNSMEPEIKEGDRVIVCPGWAPKNGDEVICRTIDGDVMCKIYQTKFNGQFVILSSYNPAFPPRELAREEIVWIYPIQSVQKVRRQK